MAPANAALVLALIAQVIWTFVVMVRAGRSRFRAAREKRLTGDIALTHDGWPDDVRKVGNNMNNQFETPTLFYALGILALVVNGAGLIMAALAWAYVATRVIHTGIHTGANRVLSRFKVFFAGLACLAGMTLLLTLHVLATVLAG